MACFTNPRPNPEPRPPSPPHACSFCDQVKPRTIKGERGNICRDCATLAVELIDDPTTRDRAFACESAPKAYVSPWRGAICRITATGKSGVVIGLSAKSTGGYYLVNDGGPDGRQSLQRHEFTIDRRRQPTWPGGAENLLTWSAP